MFPVQKYTPSGQRSRRSNHGFTLIELLMVIAVIMILAGITFGISRGVENAKRRSVAKAELTVIAQALEQFKLRHGDHFFRGPGLNACLVNVRSVLLAFFSFAKARLEDTKMELAQAVAKNVRHSTSIRSFAIFPICFFFSCVTFCRPQL